MTTNLEAAAAEARGRVERLEAIVRDPRLPFGSPRFQRAKEQLAVAKHDLEEARRAIAIRDRDRERDGRLVR